jgi:hypothetical protein
MSAQEPSRGDWAELGFEHLSSIPLVSEFVFRSPRYRDNESTEKSTEKEVVDHLFLCDGKCLLISQKVQDDPTKRTQERNQQWVLKNIQRSLRPITGAIRNPPKGPIWCNHPRLGRVEFDVLPPVVHGVVLAETWRPVKLSPIAASLPSEIQGIPISYFSINDFMNILVRLRTIPEVIEYLSARRALAKECLNSVGDEMALFGLYLMQGGSLEGGKGNAEAKQRIRCNRDSFQKAIERNNEQIRFSSVLEHAADCLATRDPNWFDGITEEMRSLFDPDIKRRNYVLLQEPLTRLRLRERAELGRCFYSVMQRTAEKRAGISFAAGHIDGNELLFLFISARGESRKNLFGAMQALTRAALAHYKMGRCWVISDRDGTNFEVALTVLDYSPTPEDIAEGKRLFGPLKTLDVDVSGL